MSELDSELQPARLTPERLPAYAPHHRAKHGLLLQYMNVWLPKLGFTYDQVALVDGFASAGRYRGDQRGSPLIMLDAYVGRKGDRSHFKNPPHFVFIESRKGYAHHLKAEVDAYPTLHGATVDVIHGTYEKNFPEVVEHLATAYRQPVPTFALVDPRGYRDSPFSHIALFKRRMPQSTEAMVYVPASFMARFLATGKTDAALMKLYGGPTWEQAKEEGKLSRQRAGARLAELFGDQLRKYFDWVTNFNVDPEHRNDYYLLFGTGHSDGLREMKRAMWHVDTHAGTGFKQAKTRPGQDQLFSDEAVAPPPDTTVLLRLLREEFGTRVFSIEEAEDFTLTRTRYLDRPHLRSWALKPAEQEGILVPVDVKPKRRKGDFPSGTTMRFVKPERA
jgi:three-Cys-motif partner protein